MLSKNTVFEDYDNDDGVDEYDTVDQGNQQPDCIFLTQGVEDLPDRDLSRSRRSSRFPREENLQLDHWDLPGLKYWSQYLIELTITNIDHNIW